MGSSMCGHIIHSCSPSYPTVVYNRTATKTQALVELGAKVVDSPEAVADDCDVLFTIVGYPHDVRAVYLGDGTSQHQGVLSRLRPGAVLIDMTTSEPTLAVEIARVAAEKGIGALDAPVSGGDVGAKNATLSIMVGGEEGTYQTVLPLLQAMGKNITLCGGPGAGQHTKMVNQTLIASNMVGVCEGLLYAQKAGLDPMRTIQAVAAGAAGSWSISNLGPRIVQRNFEPGVSTTTQ
jgi:3-hydroxyisobutyrate dehydrogenase